MCAARTSSSGRSARAARSNGGAATRAGSLGVLELAVPGRHNLQNALAAVAVALQIGVRFDQAASALRGFEGAERRFERHGEAGGVLVVDDYAHHPTEIAAVLAAARASLGRRLIVAFQPHRYTRTQSLMDAFGPSLKDADEIVLTDIYAAGEDPIPGVTRRCAGRVDSPRIGPAGACGPAARRRSCPSWCRWQSRATP